MIFTDFLKVREEKNKYGMIALTFNRSKKLSHIVPNVAFTNAYNKGGNNNKAMTRE